ncbi:HIRAN domain-containing protein [Novosphingobium resinovorum]|uniref:HIRAN domain-containing protein n=1 Tax=Novosphingobium resinovorum TaxID=158500 RepID=A0A1D8A4Z9_9SPHN|nr:HIRAN domain-containing protein [Novosphingobium resinovorum]AOR77197.1 hypothetical protein BES08_10880 [Novosphingobium resinovorum]
MPPQQSLAVVGMAFPNKGRGPTRQFEIAMCDPGDPVELRPEPKNPADERAIAVYSERGVQMGYLRAEHAYRMGKHMAAGHTITAIFQEATKYGAAIRVAFDDEEPALPTPRREVTSESVVENDDGFWPDPVWDD